MPSSPRLPVHGKRQSLPGLKPKSMLLALEPRMLFDGAGVVAAADAAGGQGDAAYQERAPVQPQDASEGDAAHSLSSEPFALPGDQGPAPSLSNTAKDVRVQEPSDLNKPGADTTTLGDWKITGATGPDDKVTVTVGMDTDGNGTLGDRSGKGTVTGNGYTLTGTAAEVQAWLNQLTFTAADKELGSTASKTTLTVDIAFEDGSHASSETLDIVVTPSNDKVIVEDGNAKVDEGGSVIIGKDALNAIDPEVTIGAQNPSQIVYRLEALPEYGHLMLNGVRLGVGSIFTQQDVLDNKLTYQHTGTGDNQNTQDRFSISVNDGATPQGASDKATVTLDILPVNQAPTVSGDGWVYEGQPLDAQAPGSSVGNFITADGGGDPNDDSLIIKVTGGTGEGDLFYTGKVWINGVETIWSTPTQITDAMIAAGFVINYADRAGLTYKHNGNESGKADSFTIEVTDGGGGQGADHAKTTKHKVDIAIHAVNDDPTFVGDSKLEARVTPNGPDNTPGGGDDYRVTLTPDMLSAVDVDSDPTQITFVVTQTPAHGEVLLNGKVLPKGGTFTMKDVIDGKVTYLQSDRVDADNAQDGFKFQVRDNALSLHWNEDGTSYERPGGIYDGPGKDAALTVFDFTVNLVLDQDPNGGHGGGQPETSVPESNLNTEHAGQKPGSPMGEILEGGSIVIWGDNSKGNDPMLHYTAEGVDPTQVVYTITDMGGPGGWNGQLLKTHADGTVTVLGKYSTFTQDDLNNGRISFKHDGGEQFESSVKFQISAGGIGPDGSGLIAKDVGFGFYVTPVNDGPEIGGSGDITIKEGATVDIGDNILSFTDPDDAKSPQDYLEGGIYQGQGDNASINHGANGSPYLQFVFTELPANGKVQWQDDSGAWHDLTSADLNSKIFNVNPATGGSASALRYVHDGSEVREVNFKVQAVDNRGARSDIAAVNIHITPENDGPTIPKHPGAETPPADGGPNNIGPGNNTNAGSVNEPLVVIEEGYYTQITSDHLQAYDPDSSADQVQYTVTKVPGKGSLAYSTDGGKTFTLIGEGSSFTQAQVNAGYIYYRHDGTEPTSDGLANPDDKFEFTLADGDKEQPGNEFWIYVKPVNDAPEVDAPTDGPIKIDSGDANNNKIPGFSVGDIDLAENVKPDVEEDYLHVTVRLLKEDGTPFTKQDYIDRGVTFIYGTGQSISGDLLTLQGTRAEIKAALDGLGLSFGSDQDQIYQIEVLADDRLRDSTTGKPRDKANGGPNNQATVLPGAPEAISTAELDMYKDKAPGKGSPLSGNIGSNSVVIWASHDNDPAVLKGPGAVVDVYEDQPTFIGGQFEVSDAESKAFGTDVVVTISVPTGQGSLSIGSADGVKVEGNNSGKLVLTGQADKIQALLNDAVNGLKYTSPADGNHDYNGDQKAGDVTLTMTLDDAPSRVGNDTGSNSQPANPAPIEIALTIIPVNDAPTVGVGPDTKPLPVTGPTNVPGISIGDVDILGDNGGIAAGEGGDFIEVTLRISDKDGKPLPPGSYKDASDNVIIITSTATGHGATVDATHDGQGNALVIRGTRDQVNAYLAGLQVSIGGELANTDTNYRLDVIADDRVRDPATGALDTGKLANGGANNNGNNGTALVPDTEIDPYAAVPGGLSNNVGLGVRDLFPTGVNDPANIEVDAADKVETDGTYQLNGIEITDVDALDSKLTVTVTLPDGFTFKDLGAGGAVDSGAAGGNTVTFTGTLDQINQRINSLVVQLPDADGNAGSADWNGSFKVSVTINDNGNNGGRPGSLPTVDPSHPDYKGDFTYEDGTSNKLVTQRDFIVTVKPVNDAPVVIEGGEVVLTPVPEDSSAAGADSPDGETIENLFGDRFDDAKDQINNGTPAIDATDGSDSDAFHGVAITGLVTDARQGEWQYSIDNGQTWIVVGDRSPSNALVLDADAKLRFVPAKDFHGTPNKLTVALVEKDDNTDQAGSVPASGSVVDLSGADARGGTTLFSQDSIVLSTTVANVNDRPTLSGPAELPAVNEDAVEPPGKSVNDLFGDKYADQVDNQGDKGANISGGGNAGADFGGIAIVDNNANPATEGSWQYKTAGGAWVNVPADVSETNALILPKDAELRFVPVENFNGTPGNLTVRAADTEQSFAGSTDISNLTNDANKTSTWSNAQTLSTTVTSVNDAPVLKDPDNFKVPDQTNRDSDKVVSFDPKVDGAFSDVENDTLTYTAANLPPGLTMDPITGIISGTLDPSASQGGSDGVYTVTITVADGKGGTATVDFTWTVTNPPPVAVDDIGATEENTVITGNVLTGNPANNDAGADSDPDGDRLTVTEVTNADGAKVPAGTPIAGVNSNGAKGGGSFTINPDGSYTFNPGTDFDYLAKGKTATTTVTYKISDGEGGFDEATLTITVTGANDAPIVTPGMKIPNQTDVDGKAIAPVDVSGNFTDVDGDKLSFTASGLPSGLTIDPNTGLITGTPNPSASQGGANGVYTVIVTATDSSGVAVEQTFTWTVSNPAPVASGDTGTTDENTSLTVTDPSKGVLGNDTDTDGDTLFVDKVVGKGGTEVGVGTGVAGSNGGTFTINADGTYTFDPGSDFQHLGSGQTAQTTVTYTVTDKEGGTSTATLTVTVTGVNDAPVWKDPSFTVPDQSNQDSDKVTGFDPGVKDAFDDSDGDIPTFKADGLPPGLTMDPNTGIISGTLDPSASQGGKDGVYTVTITVDDGKGGKTDVSFEWDVSNPPPEANDDGYSVNRNDPPKVLGNVLGNDRDPDGDKLTVKDPVTRVPGSNGGWFTIHPDGTVTFETNGEFRDLEDGQEKSTTLTYTVVDADGKTDTATITVTVKGIDNGPPIANPDSGQVNADDTLVVGPGNGVLQGSSGNGTDIDPDSDKLVITGVTTGTAPDAGSVGTGNVGSALTGSLGTLILNADGSYSYVADQPGAKALKTGETAVDVFTYAISDGHGGVSYTTLSITVTGIERVLPVPNTPDAPPLSGAWTGSSQYGSLTDILNQPPYIWGADPREHQVINLPIPMQPVVYVEVTVQREQALREEGALRALGADASVVMFGDSQISNNNGMLGQDQVIYVKHEVDVASQEAGTLYARTLGRSGRTSLSADNLLPNHSIFAWEEVLQLHRQQASLHQSAGAVDGANQASTHGDIPRDQNAGSAASMPKLQDNTADLPADQKQAGVSPPAPRGASAFSQQLRQLAAAASESTL